MINIAYIEKQANKRVHPFLIHKATQENIATSDAQFVINSTLGRATIHLFNKHRFVKTISFKEVAEFFGKDYSENGVIAIHDYLAKLAKEQHIELSKVNILICETEKELGAHLYDEGKYKKRISTVDLLSHLNSSK